MQVGYLGVGNMGQPMAGKLMDAGHSLVVFDISEAAMEPLLLRQARRAVSSSVMVSGDPAAIERVRPLIASWGPTLTIAGDKPGAAQVLKLTNNILFAVSLAATSEAFVMGAKAGLDPEVMVNAINAGSGRNGATMTVMPNAILDRSFGYGAAMHILMKDIDLAIAQGEALGVPMWVCQAARLVYKHAMFEGAADADISTLVRQVESGAGFQMPKTR